VPRYRAGDEQQVGMTRACNKPNIQSFEVVEGIVKRVDLEFTAVAGARIDMANAQRAPENCPDMVIQAVSYTQKFIRKRGSLRDYSN
jgi:hypothetical protein